MTELEFDLIQLVDNDELQEQSMSTPPSLQLVPADELQTQQTTSSSSTDHSRLPSVQHQPEEYSNFNLGDIYPPLYTHQEIQPSFSECCISLRAVFFASILQLIITGGTVTVGALCIAYCSFMSFIGHAFWTAVACSVAAIVGICMRRNSTNTTFLYMMLSVIAVSCSLITMALAIYGSVVDSSSHNQVESRCQNEPRFAASLSLAIIAFLHVLLSAYGVTASCVLRNRAHRENQVFYTTSSDAVYYTASEQREMRMRGNLQPLPPPPYSLPPYTPPEQPPPYKQVDCF